jgi:MFS family permease
MSMSETRLTPDAPTDTSLTAFYKELTTQERRTFWTCFTGWGLDALDFMIYPLVIGTIMTLWKVDTGVAGLAVTGTLLTSAIGGWLAGYLADRIGRVKTLQITVAWFCIFSIACAFVRNFDQLMIARAILGFGFGGEWAAGAVLIAETIRPAFRGRAVGVVQSAWAVGWGGAVLLQAVMFSVFPPETAWRAMFAFGVLPALLLVYARRHVREPEIAEQARKQLESDGNAPSLWEIFRPGTLKTTILGSIFMMGCQGGYYAISTWIPTFLKTERHLTVINSTGYLGFLITGSFLGYLFGAWMSDRFGRKKLFVSFRLRRSSWYLPTRNSALATKQSAGWVSRSGFFPAAILPEWDRFFPNFIRRGCAVPDRVSATTSAVAWVRSFPRWSVRSQCALDSLPPSPFSPCWLTRYSC